MKRNFSHLLQGVVISAACLAAAPSRAETLTVDTNFGWLSVGSSTTISEGHVFWLGEFSGTLSDMGAGTILDHAAVQCPAWFDINFVTGVRTAGGYCVTTLTTGDTYQISFTYEGSLAGATGAGPYPLGPDGGRGVGTVVGATGALAGTTGGNIFEAYTVLFHPDGKGSGYSILRFTLNLP